MLTRLKTKLWPRLGKTLERWRDDDGDLLATSVAYYAVFSVFPMLLILISVLGFLLTFSSSVQDAQQELLEMVQRHTSVELAGHVRRTLDEVRSKAVVTGPVGVIALLFGAIGIFVHVDKAFDRIWDVDSNTSDGFIAGLLRILFHRARAFLMLLALGILIVAAIAAGVVASAARVSVDELPGGWWTSRAVQIALGLLVNWLLLSLIYKVLPKPHVRWRAALQGGLLAAVAWEVCRQLLAFVVMGGRYSAFGVIGSMIALMIWIYIAVSVIFLGAVYVRVVSDESLEKT